jgi:hypothetical protein
MYVQFIQSFHLDRKALIVLPSQNDPSSILSRIYIHILYGMVYGGDSNFFEREDNTGKVCDGDDDDDGQAGRLLVVVESRKGSCEQNHE